MGVDEAIISQAFELERAWKLVESWDRVARRGGNEDKEDLRENGVGRRLMNEKSMMEELEKNQDGDA